MKKLLLILSLTVFTQNIDTLSAMQNLLNKCLGSPMCQDPFGGYTNMRNTLEQKAEYAAATINDWLTPQLTQELVEMVEERDPGTNEVLHVPQLNLEKLSKLPVGQQIVLTTWASHPRYWTLVFYHFKQRVMWHSQEGFVFSYAYTPFMNALIRHNFNKDILSRLKAIKDNGFAPLLKLENFIPQLEHLRYQSSCMNDLEFKDELKKYDVDIQDCFYALQHPYFFVDFLEHYAESNQHNMIKLFLDYGFDVNCPLMNLLTNANDTMLHKAVQYDHFNTVLCLLTYQAGPLQNNVAGKSAWILSLEKMKYFGTELSEDAKKIYKMLCYSVPKERKADLNVRKHQYQNNNNNNNDIISQDNIIIEENFGGTDTN